MPPNKAGEPPQRRSAKTASGIRADAMDKP